MFFKDYRFKTGAKCFVSELKQAIMIRTHGGYFFINYATQLVCNNNCTGLDGKGYFFNTEINYCIGVKPVK